MAPKPTRREAERFGRLAEGFAAAFLLFKGYLPLARRFKTPLGEIDLIVRRGRTLVFVEVKARKNLDDGLDAVHVSARERIGRAAHWWLARHPGYAFVHCRFDVVIVLPWALPVHIAGAFEPRSLP